MGLDHTLTISGNTLEPKVYEFRKVYPLQIYFEEVYNIQNGELIEIDISDIQKLNKNAVETFDTEKGKRALETLSKVKDIYLVDDLDVYDYIDTKLILESTTDILNQYVEGEHILTYWCWY